MYKIIKREVVNAPDITHDHIMSMTEAAELLEIAVSNVGSLLNNGRLTTVVDDTVSTAYGNPRRLLLREEVLEYKRERDELRGKGLPAEMAAVG